MINLYLKFEFEGLAPKIHAHNFLTAYRERDLYTTRFFFAEQISKHNYYSKIDRAKLTETLFHLFLGKTFELMLHMEPCMHYIIINATK